MSILRAKVPRNFVGGFEGAYTDTLAASTVDRGLCLIDNGRESFGRLMRAFCQPKMEFQNSSESVPALCFAWADS